MLFIKLSFLSCILFTSISPVLVSEYDCGYQVNEKEIVKMEKAKSFFIAGKSILQGYKSSISIQGTESSNQIKASDKLTLYVKFYDANKLKDLSVIKFNKVKKKRKAKSIEVINRKNIAFSSIKIELFDTENKIYKISFLGKQLSPGNYCLCFIGQRSNGLNMIGGQVKFVYDFDIIE